ncbi:MAG: hypothetical protein ACRD0O_03180 [Acidimicrobiia bacterium]
MTEEFGTGLNPEGFEQVASLLAVSFSGGRRAAAVLDAGPNRGFQTDLRTVAVPHPLPGPGEALRTLACGVALQSSPSKESVAAMSWWKLPRRQRRALAWVEGEAAVRWATETWPGLGPALAERFPFVEPGPALVDGEALVADADRRARSRLPALPALFGRLPPPPARSASPTRKTYVATPWTTREVNPRATPDSIPVSGSAGEDIVSPGLPEGLEALEGQGRRLFGIPYDEWDSRQGRYRRDFVRVVELRGRASGRPEPLLALPPLLPYRSRLRNQEQGDVDVDAVVAWRCDLAAGYPAGDPRLFTDLAPAAQPVVWSLLVDGSASTSAGGGRVFHRALRGADAAARTLCLHGLPVSVFTFRSFTRERVEMRVLKDFDAPYKPFGPGPDLRPDGYTRLGAALRHAGQRLLERPGWGHVLISLGDALASDEGYDGAYARADVAKAVEELRRRGALVAHVSVAPADVPAVDEMFGVGGWTEARTPAQMGRLLVEIAADLRRAC